MLFLVAWIAFSSFACCGLMVGLFIVVDGNLIGGYKGQTDNTTTDKDLPQMAQDGWFCLGDAWSSC